MIVIRMLLLLVFLFVAPVLLGAPWTTLLPAKNRYRLCACFPIGVFVQLAIFQLLEVPIAFLHLPFTLLCWIFAGVVAAACVISGVIFGKKKPFFIRFPRLNGWEIFYLIIFLALLGWQLYNGFTMDATIWSYDDAAYVTYAADTLRSNAIQTVNPYTGIALTFNVHRAMQGWIYYSAFLSKVSSVSIAAMERTILETYDIALAYAVYIYMASVLFFRKDNGLIFLIILSFLMIFGLYSQYSVTFRLLGPNYHGKAILAVSFFPLLFVLLIQTLNKTYNRKTGCLLLLLSVAATSLTMFGAVTMVLNTSLVVALYTVCRRRSWDRLKYIPWSSLLPALYCGIYFLYRYGQF